MNLKCQFCDKYYASYQSRCNHIKKYHTLKSVVNVVEKSEKKVKNNKNVVVNVVESDSDNLNCKHCNKKLCDRFYRWKHEQKCIIKKKDKEKNDIENIVANKVNEILKTMKIHPNALKKINNQLNCNNTIINNTVISVSDQNLKEILKKSEKMEVLNSGSNAHLKLTDIIYKNPEYKNFRDIYITNLSNDIGYMYDKKTNRFIVKTKKNILDDYGIERFSDIQYFYEELENKIDKKQLAKLKKMVYDYFNDNDFKDSKNKEILIELYNNKIQVQQIYETINKSLTNHNDNIKDIEI